MGALESTVARPQILTPWVRVVPQVILIWVAQG